ncbi:IclR family transcriptional regulator [Rhizohabitans arisaemae]|uniref:IclR family transcriptional regulator n=1 Tax=Rhizohabitans arisaemae TaxID=2720610 RepID=UPI0024B0B242|nr:IclR family transcriptional regulator [Rhizohabitans arisaemae]
MEGESKPTLISSVQRALRLLEAVAGHESGAPAKLLARQAGLPLATTYHLLRTLLHEGYLRKTDEGCYVIGERVDTLHGQSRTQALLSRVHPVLSGLRDELGMAVYLSLYLDGEIRVVDVADGPRAPRVDLWVGVEDSGHATALGKCVLRQLGTDERRDYLFRHPLFDLTPNTITEVRDLLRRLDDGPGTVVYDNEEYALGTACAAVPVGDGKVVGALAVSTKPSRLGRAESLPRRLQVAAERLSRTIHITM